MYNDTLKAKYIETLDKDSLKELLTNEFEACASTEEKLNKDIKDFSRAEILEYYTSLRSYSLDALMVRNYRFEHYVNWCFENEDRNEFTNITTEMLMECLDHKVVDSLILTREQVVGVADSLPCGEAFLVLGLFEGICGKDYEEFHNLSMDNFVIDGDIITVSLCTGRTLTVTRELYEYAKKATNQYSYDKNEKTIYFDDADTRILKNRTNAGREADSDLTEDIIYRRNYRRILNITMRLRKETQMQGLKISFLQASGRIHLMKELMKRDGVDIPRPYVNCDEAKDRYGIVSSIPRWLMKYEQYF